MRRTIAKIAADNDLAELIKAYREKAKQKFEVTSLAPNDIITAMDFGMYLAYTEIIKSLELLIHPAETVLCKDCKHWGGELNKKGKGKCKAISTAGIEIETSPDMSCSVSYRRNRE